MYSVPNLRVTSGLAKRNIGTPTSMRGPGAVPGLFALESAMDELAIKLGMDPVAAAPAERAEHRRGHGLPFSSRHFQECLTARRGAIRLVQARPQGRLDAARRPDARLGHGGLLLARRAVRLHRRRSSCATTARCACRLRCPGHRHRHLHRHGADGGRAARRPIEQVEVALGDTACRRGRSPADRC